MGTGGKVAAAAAIVVAAGVVAAAVLFAWGEYESFVGRGAQRTAQAAAVRKARTTAVIVVAPAPLPSALPLVERAGADAFGYPRSYVDAAALRSLLHHVRFQELSQCPRVIERWTGYLARHPDDPRALFERSGAYHDCSDETEAIADCRAPVSWGRAEPTRTSNG